MQQQTIKHPVQCSGVGLHSGKMVNMALRPADEDSGINFYVFTPEGSQRIVPEPAHVIATGLATTIGTSRASISTVEHLMAAILGLGIDNLRIDVHGGELPIMDGSAAPFVMLLNGAGIKKQTAARKVLRIAKPINHTQGEKSIYAEPYDGFFVDYTIDFAHPLIGVQNLALEITPQTFSEIAKARTFGFFKEVEYLYSRGLALGGSLDNSVVLDEHGVLNQEGLRFSDEFVRHKLLDFIGDMAMINLPLQGRFTVHCSGHTLNNQFLRVLDENRAIYLEEIVLDVPAYTHRKNEKDRAEERKGNELRNDPVNDPVPVL
ncbi:MAG: UDP-3-O-acyl-N-acetylglucosamine deacetylase [Deltaproteobacteria bacterium]|jgi:UDP-3-O-[3-hydroxymyristoyl] N-acetylglucosamine deacetylase|nr:UDP-3-O-acyl-N-acetylglucosamine deacetylase [Deltaproteobacteria bacterium]